MHSCAVGLARWAPLLALVAAAPAGATCPVRPAWPTQGWPDSRASFAATHADALRNLEDYILPLDGKDADQRGIRTDGLVIIQHGELVYQHYQRGFDAGKRHLLWSASKSLTNALVGVGVEQGLFSVEDSICDYRGFADPAYCDISIKDLLDWGSGIRWAESYEGLNLRSSSVLAMLYGIGHGDMAGFVSSHRTVHGPGAHFSYSTGDTTLLCSVIDGPMRDANGDNYPWAVLFDRLGMDSATWETDGRGTLVGGSYAYATPLDAAKFGFLFLNDGCWDGLRVLPEGWVEWSSSVSDAFKRGHAPEDDASAPGYSWWTNRSVPENGNQKPWPDAPDDLYQAAGHWGQSITVIPSLDAVAVRTADDRDDTLDDNTYLRLLAEVLQ